MEFKIGCDPELFVRNPNSKEFLSGYGLIPGTKWMPHKVNKGAVQVDGMALEFNTDPALSADEFCANISTVRRELQNMVPGYELVADPVAEFGMPMINSQPDEAKELGCEPDYDAWNDGLANPRPDGDRPFRTGSGHIHIGWGDGIDVRSKNHLEDCMAMVKQLDYTLGIYSLLWDTDGRRRELYGKAGAFRPKPYGVEYRVMSNAWLRDERLVRWVYNAAIFGAKALANGENFASKFGSKAQSIINNNQTEWYQTEQFGIAIPTPPGLKDIKVA